MMNYSAFNNRSALVCSALSTFVASIALAGEPRAPTCLLSDGSTQDTGGACCDTLPATYGDENGPPGNGTVIGELLTRSDTFHSIGMVWDIDGDEDRDSSVSVRYRQLGACKFEPAMPLVRTHDYSWYFHDQGADEPVNNYAGSLMFLTPGTTYEVVLELADPDGGRALRVSELTTRAIPSKPTGGRILYVIPGTGGGDGSTDNPFRGIDAANAAAIPGDTFRLRDGNYTGTATISTPGAENNYIVYEPDIGASPVIEAIAITSGSHTWFDNLTFIRGADDSALYVPWAPTPWGPEDVVVTNNTFTGYLDSVRGYYGGEAYQVGGRWTVMDNVIIGDKPEGVGTNGPADGNGGGIELNYAGGHVIAYNSVSRVGDGIATGQNSDVYGNDVFDIADDSLSTDGGQANVRVWGNRMHEAAAYNISFQPQVSGPWYFVRNQMAQATYGPIKWRVQDRIVFVNNTIIGNTNRSQYFMKTITRNNLFIRGAAPVWAGSGGGSTIQSPPQWLPSWNTDVDYNGFDWGSNTTTAFAWFDGTQYYPDLQSFAQAVGVEQNGRRVNRNQIFEAYVVSRDWSLTLDPSGNAVDAGAPLPNLADFYEGGAPDLGAHESGATPLQFGPRNGVAALDQQPLEWAKH